MMQAFMRSDEMIYDGYRQDFEFIVSQCRKLLDVDPIDGAMSRQLFSLHLGYIPPLFFTATRCRNPCIRRQAITVLHNSTRRERVWGSFTAAKIAERVVQIEERDLVVSGCQDVPMSRRIMLINPTFDANTYITHVQFKLAPWNNAAQLEEEMIYWKRDRVSDEILTPELTTRKILRAAGYASNLLSCRIIRGRCPPGAVEWCMPATCHNDEPSTSSIAPSGNLTNAAPTYSSQEAFGKGACVAEMSVD